MNIRPVLAVTAISFVIGTFGFVAPNRAIAANPHHPQVKHRQPRQQQSKLLPQPDHQEVNHHQVRPNHR